MPKDDDDVVLRAGADDDRHVGFHDHAIRHNHEQAARLDESSCGDDDVDSDIDLDVIVSNMA